MKPRLLIIIPRIGRAGGGVSEAARLLTQGLDATKQFEIHVLTLGTDDDLHEEVNWPKVTFHYCRSWGPKRYGLSPGMAFHMASNVYDVIHVHGLWTFHVAAAAVGIARGFPTIFSAHGMLESWILRRSPIYKSLVNLAYQMFSLRRAFSIHALTAKERDDIRAVYPDARISTIPNFVPRFPQATAAPIWLTPDMQRKKIFLFFGRIHDKKGWKPLLGAWERACLENHFFLEKAALVFCGWTDGVQDFELEIDALYRRFNNVFYEGPQYGASKIASYSVADYFVLPSRSEGLPMAVLEAIRAGLVILMSRACNLAEIIDLGGAIDSGEACDSIYKSLVRAFNLTEDEKDNFRRISSDYLEENYSLDRVVGRFSELYLEASRFDRRKQL